MTLNDKFDAAANSVRGLSNRPTDSELLELYALYKQATMGDCNINDPGNDEKSKAKWNAWNGKKGLNQDAAKDAYVTYANTIITKY